MAYTLPYTLFGAALGVTFLYRYLLPHPIAGIPYHKASSTSILGDIPRILKYVKEHLDLFAWLALQCTELKSPIVQVWIKPFQGPTVILTDYEEAQDILLRRTKEFDRAPFIEDIFYSIIPHATIRKKTTDAFKAQRKAFLETMSPSFVNGVGAHQLHEAAVAMVKLWQVKRTRARSRPISIAEDMKHSVFDAMWAVLFGSQLGTHETQLRLLSSAHIDSHGNFGKDIPINFPATDPGKIYTASGTLVDSIEKISSSPFPRAHHLLLCQTPKMRAAKATKDQIINDAVASSLAKFTSGNASKGEVRSAMDLVLRQQSQLASKGGELIPDAALKDELFSFLVGGHETSSTTLTWAMKYLTLHQEVQHRLRKELDSTFSTSRASTVELIQPAPEIIMEARVPYLDAVIEETLRLSCTASGISRVAMTDTTVLGHVIPKGTEVFCMNNGPTILSPALPVAKEHQYSTTSAATAKMNQWDPRSIALFDPDRWLAKNEVGNVVFNPKAGPSYPFSVGIRGCFGKRLAYAELRIFLCLIILNIELEPLPEHLNNFDAEVKMTRTSRQSFVRMGEIK